MQTYAKVVELGSFAAAADKMGQARSVVTRQIAYLEQKYGVRLLNRTTRKLSMTDAGRAFYERVRPRWRTWSCRCRPRANGPAAGCG
jgi:DNA-binding transcriptional LysR family regulator